MCQDMVGSVVNVGSAAYNGEYEGKCCKCFSILWKVLLMFNDMMGSAANVSEYVGECCSCFRKLWKELSTFRT